MSSAHQTRTATSGDDALPFFVPEKYETAVQRVLRSAFAYVHRSGMCEFVEGPDDVTRASVCGFALNGDPPGATAHAAAQCLLDEVARGSGGEADCTALGYQEILETIMIYMDSCSFDDAQACAFIEAAYRRGARRDDVFAPPDEWNRPAIIVLH